MPKYFINVGSSVLLLTIILSSSVVSYAGGREIGGYVAQAESRFQRNVWNFIKEFKSSQSIGSHTWKYDQYFWARDYLFEGNSHKSYVDAQDLVFISGHGNSYIWQSVQSPSEIVDFRNVPSYGNLSDGGDLEFLIIESCSTVATAPEAANWWTPWKKMFQGLHQLLGFRTLSYSDNGIPNAFAKNLKNNQKIWEAWFDAVNTERTWSYTHTESSGEVVPYPGFASGIMYNSTANDRLGSYASDPSPNQGFWTVWQY